MSDPIAENIAEWAATAPLGDAIWTPFGPVDPAQLSQTGRVNLAVGLQRVINWAQAELAGVLAAVADDPEPVPLSAADAKHDKVQPLTAAQLSATAELAFELHWSQEWTATRMCDAHRLVHELPETFAAFRAGTLSQQHADRILHSVRDLDPEITAEVEARVLDRAPQQTSAEFGRSVRRAVAALDSRGVEEKFRDALSERRVCYEPADDAMAWLNIYLTSADARVAMTAIQAVADKLEQPGDCRTADQLRADAVGSIFSWVLTGDSPLPAAGTATGPTDGLPLWHGRKPNVQITVALSTLAGFDDQPGELDGYGPIPASYTRMIAADPTGTWRRLVTDDVGRLIDYGRTVYKPPQDLADKVIARDRTCRAPGCNRDARRAELDHITDWALGGPTSERNIDPKCGRDHDLKDDGWTTERLSDGTTTWTSPHGRIYRKPPETYPVDRTRPKLTPELPDDPPF